MNKIAMKPSILFLLVLLGVIGIFAPALPKEKGNEYHQGIVFFQKGKFDEAKRSFEKFITHHSKEDPLHPSAFFYLAKLESNSRLAVSSYYIFLKQFPTHPLVIQIHSALAQYYYAVGNYDSVRTHYRQIQQKFPSDKDSDEIQFGIGKAFLAENKLDSAIIELRKVRIGFPSSPKASQAQFLTAQAFSQVGDFSQATIEYQRVIEYYPRTYEAQIAKEWLSLFSPDTTDVPIDSPAVETPGPEVIRPGFAIQVGAFKTLTEAQSLKKYLTDKGYEVVLHQKTVKGQLYYCLRLGNFSTEVEAKKFGEKLKSKEGLDWFVVKY